MVVLLDGEICRTLDSGTKTNAVLVAIVIFVTLFVFSIFASKKRIKERKRCKKIPFQITFFRTHFCFGKVFLNNIFGKCISKSIIYILKQAHHFSTNLKLSTGLIFLFFLECDAHDKFMGYYKMNNIK